MSIPAFSVENFESLVRSRSYEEATKELISLLQRLDANYGHWGNEFTCSENGLPEDIINRYRATRLAAAISELMVDPEYNISQNGFRQLITFHRWLSVIFGSSSFRNADHVLNRFNLAGENSKEFNLESNNIYKFCLMYTLDSNLEIQLESLWQINPEAVAALLFGIQSSRIHPSASAYGKRAVILRWMRTKIDDILNLEWTPTQIFHDVYMHCSYALESDKHAIKEVINRLMRKYLENQGLHDITTPPPKRDKPVMLVILEWFNKRHSIYRTHSSTIRAARDKFHIIGISTENTTDELTQEVFHEFHIVNSDSDNSTFKNMAKMAEEILPDVVYYPSMGMFMHTLGLANFRLAPVQIMALGHPATTYSPAIDYIVVEEDYLGDPNCFTEQVIALPKDCLPYIPPADIRRIEPMPFEQKAQPGGTIKIGIAASGMKINPTFLQVCSLIAAKSKRHIEFHFLIALANGVCHEYLRETMHDVLPSAVIHPALPYDLYIEHVNQYDLFINPFPFGNTNGIVDTIRQGLPGICFSGPEVHTHIDEGLFRRLGLPEDLIAHTYEEYIDATVRLAEDDEWRKSLNEQILKVNPDTVLFAGRPEQFGQIVAQALKTNKIDIDPSWPTINVVDKTKPFVLEGTPAASKTEKAVEPKKTVAKKATKTAAKKTTKKKD